MKDQEEQNQKGNVPITNKTKETMCFVWKHAYDGKSVSNVKNRRTHPQQSALWIVRRGAILKTPKKKRKNITENYKDGEEKNHKSITTNKTKISD